MNDGEKENPMMKYGYSVAVMSDVDVEKCLLWSSKEYLFGSS